MTLVPRKYTTSALKVTTNVHFLLFEKKTNQKKANSREKEFRFSFSLKNPFS